MRVTPLAVWARNLTKKEDLYAAVKYQTLLTHSNPTAINATYLYCYAIIQLIKKDYSAEGACKELLAQVIKEAEAFDREEESLKEWLSVIQTTSKDSQEDRKEKLPPAAPKGIGFLKIALVWAFYYLYHDFSYPEAIRDMLLQAGDTDTNAAIVGGLLGARYGMEVGEEKEWTKKVLNYDYEKCRQGHHRP